LNQLVGTNDAGVIEARLGHIASGFTNSTTPLQRTIRQVAKSIPSRLATRVYELEQELVNIHSFIESSEASVEYVFNRTSIPAGTKSIDKVLGSGTVLLTLQTNKKNQAL